MRYLLATHISAYPGQSPGVLRWPGAWVADVQAQARALRDAGFELTIAAPMLDTIEARALAKQEFVDLKLADQPFRFVPLPGFRTATQFVAARSELRKIVAQHAKISDVVQLGPGGHPVSLGQTLWPTIAGLTAKKVFVFASDPIPAREKHATSGRNPAKRLAKQLAVRQLETFCAKAIHDADVVFAQHPSVQQRFSKFWSGHCHTLFTTRLPDSLTGVPHTPDNRKPLRLLCFGSSTLTRGLDHLLRAIAKARRLSAKVELDLAGDLIGSADLMDLIRTEKLESAVRLHGVANPSLTRQLIFAADVFISSSLIPSTDPIIFLAVARGLPIVTYQSGVLDDLLIQANAGLVVPRGETNMLAQVILDLSRDRARVETMSKQAIAWASASSLDAVHRDRAGKVKALFN